LTVLSEFVIVVGPLIELSEPYTSMPFGLMVANTVSPSTFDSVAMHPVVFDPNTGIVVPN